MFFVKVGNKLDHNSHLYCAGCQFPVGWHGIWFQQGVRPYISITEDTITSKGRCHQREGGRVILEKLRGHETCFTCLVFHISHTNLIHYKESKLRSSIYTVWCGLSTGVVWC